jgi:hypothetical protein
MKKKRKNTIPIKRRFDAYTVKSIPKKCTINEKVKKNTITGDDKL